MTEIRSYPHPGIDRSETLISHSLLALLSLPNLSALAWTRHKSLSTGLITAMATSMPHLRDLEINASSSGVYDPRSLLRVKGLNRLSLIMPDKDMIGVLEDWFKVLDQPTGRRDVGLTRLSIVCKVSSAVVCERIVELWLSDQSFLPVQSSSLIRDHHFEAWAPYLSHLQELSLTACTRISTAGLAILLSASDHPSITHLGLESLEHVDVLGLRLPTLAPSLKYLSFTHPEPPCSGVSATDKTLHDLLTSFKDTLETLHLHYPASNPDVSFSLPDVRFPKLRLMSLSPKIGWRRIDHGELPELRQLFVGLSHPRYLTPLGAKIRETGHLRALQILAPSPDQYSWEPSVQELGALLDCQPSLRQIGFGTKVFKVRPISRVRLFACIHFF